MNKIIRYLLVSHWIMGKRTSFKNFETKEMYYKLEGLKIPFLISTIKYIEGKKRHCIIHFINGTCISFPKSIGFFSPYLAANHFGRFHKGFIMNFHCILFINEVEGCVAMMGNDDWCPISRRETAIFLETFGRFVKFKGIRQRRK
jgi:hypothetical protein